MLALVLWTTLSLAQEPPLEPVPEAPPEPPPLSFCDAARELVAASRDGFFRVRGEPSTAYISWYKTTVSLPGTVDQTCKVLRGADGPFVTCDMGPVSDRAAAETLWQSTKTTMLGCGIEWPTDETPENSRKERHFRWKKEANLGPSVEIHLKNRGNDQFQVQVWFKAIDPEGDHGSLKPR